VREEMARTVEDVLARRCRALFLNAAAAEQIAEETARVLAVELGQGHAWQRQQIQAFSALAAQYRLPPT
jgi:glycerol-3-phosphate dehydrogenase